MPALVLDGQRYPYEGFEGDYYWSEEIPGCPQCGAALRTEDNPRCRVVPVQYRRESGWREEVQCWRCGWMQQAEA